MTAKPRSHYASVAEVYLKAADARTPPLKAVAATWTVPHSTAARWVKRARDLGVLPPTRAGKWATQCNGKCPVHCGKAD